MPRMIPTDPKICQQCGVTYHRPPRMSVKNWTASRWCSLGCMIASKRVAPRLCGRCNQPIPIKHRESASRRKFCSLQCANAGKPINPVTTRYRTMKTPEGRIRAVHRVRMEQHLGRTLETSEHVHHRDENKLNNELANLEVQSSSHHARHHMKGNRHAAQN